jgi:hypothetical protein
MNEGVLELYGDYPLSAFGRTSATGKRVRYAGKTNRKAALSLEDKKRGNYEQIGSLTAIPVAGPRMRCAAVDGPACAPGQAER